ncbi:unnamed protein product [Onchocerca flexuosa]|uniref:Protein Wnt n=1 Tax=Onchocerca flexuosa TaxID=387005 RepID=A0A183H785_9BILA|nr:unnamed protein product [Onchocerca flexuosa]
MEASPLSELLAQLGYATDKAMNDELSKQHLVYLRNSPDYCEENNRTGNMVYSFINRGYSSVAEHSTADREVPGSNPGAPFPLLQLQKIDDLNAKLTNYRVQSNIIGSKQLQ